jgi:hypothetical protein
VRKAERSICSAFDLLRKAMNLKTVAEEPAASAEPDKIQVIIPRVPPVLTDDQKYQTARLFESILNLHYLTADKFLTLTAEPLTWYGYVSRKVTGENISTVYEMDLFNLDVNADEGTTAQAQIARLVAMMLRRLGIEDDEFVDLLTRTRL